MAEPRMTWVPPPFAAYGDILRAAAHVCDVAERERLERLAQRPIGFVRPDDKTPGRYVFINFHEGRNPDLPWEPVYRAPGVQEVGK